MRDDAAKRKRPTLAEQYQQRTKDWKLSKGSAYRRKTGARNSGSRRCSWCLELGHDLRNCEKARGVRRPHRRHGTSNADYRENRRLKICDNCGADSPRYALCDRCRAACKLRPSRDGKNPKVIAQRKRWRVAAKQRARAA